MKRKIYNIQIKTLDIKTITTSYCLLIIILSTAKEKIDIDINSDDNYETKNLNDDKL